MSRVSAKDEALRAVVHARDHLAAGDADGLVRAQLVAVLDYAAEQIQLIQEVKRARRPAAAILPGGQIPAGGVNRETGDG